MRRVEVVSGPERRGDRARSRNSDEAFAPGASVWEVARRMDVVPRGRFIVGGALLPRRVVARLGPGGGPAALIIGFLARRPIPAISSSVTIRITYRFKAPKLFLRCRLSALDEPRYSNPFNTMPPSHLFARNRCL